MPKIGPVKKKRARKPIRSGIYRIRNLINEKIYIGSADNLDRRKNEHWKELRDQSHCNPHLQASWNKHGEISFTFEVVEECLPASA